MVLVPDSALDIAALTPLLRLIRPGLAPLKFSVPPLMVYPLSLNVSALSVESARGVIHRTRGSRENRL
jgi:hypothetical protein